MADPAASQVEVFRAAGLQSLPHGFLGRGGGVSTGLVAGLQVGHGAGDDAPAVVENRRRALAAVCPGAQLATVQQVHSNRVHTVTAPFADDARPEVDAMVTDRPGLALGIVTADCAPVLLADRGAGIIGAAHAGWRGAHGGVLEATVQAMEALGAHAASIVAAIGPCIAQASYEVGNDLRDRFDPGDARFFGPGRPGHWQFDLAGYVAHRLASRRVGAIEVLGLDTYAREDSFYSYRRSVHRGEPTYGRQMSLIALV